MGLDKGMGGQGVDMNPKWETQNGILVAPPESAKRIEALERAPKMGLSLAQ